MGNASKPVRAAFTVGWVFGIDASEFFRDYRLYVGGKASSFDVPTSVGIDLATFQLKRASIGISSGYYRAVVRETYDYNPLNAPIANGPRQSVTQTVTLSVIPTMIGIDYFPMERQFATYAGFAAGLGAIHAYWEESLSPSNEPGARSSGIRYDEWHLAPALYGRVGISLCFDDEITKKVRAGLNLETGFLYVPFSAPLFQETAKTLENSPQPPDQEYGIQAGGITLKLGFFLLLDGK